MRVMLLLLQFPEGRAASFTLGASDILRTTTETTAAMVTMAAETGGGGRSGRSLLGLDLQQVTNRFTCIQ